MSSPTAQDSAAALPLPSSSSSSIFPNTPRKLADVAPDGTKFYQEHPDQLPLSARLQRLWGERGDFSRFSVKRLKLDSVVDGESEDVVKAELKPADLLEDEQEEGGEDKKGNGATLGMAGIPVGGAIAAAASGKASLTIREMTQLKADMLRELQAAHHSLYLAHALVSMVLNTRTASTGINGAGPGAARAGSTFSRAESPQTAASRTARGTNQSTAALGSAAAIESELGLEADALGVSVLDQRRTAAREAEGADDEADDAKDGANREEESAADKRRKKLLARDEKRTIDEVDEETREAALALMSKKKGLSNAVAILRRGAEELEQGQTEDDQRWEAMRELRSKGWGITPGNPSGSMGGEVEGPRRVIEGERDAWIGYGLPEAGPSYRARSLAYLTSSSDEGPVKESKDAGKGTPVPPSKAQLKFVTPRTGKRLRLSVVDTNSGLTWASGKAEEKGEGEGDVSLDEELRGAQEEMADLELFDSLSREARKLNAQGVASARVKDGHIAVSLHSGCELRLELAEPSSQETQEGSPPARSRIADLVLAVLRLWSLRRSERLSALERVLGWAHYASFVDGLRKSLAQIDEEVLDGGGDGQEAKREGKVQVELGSAAGSVKDVAAWIAELAPCDALGGTGRLLLDGSPLALLTLSFPSNLNVSLLPGAEATSSGPAPARSLDVDGAGLLEVLRLAVAEARGRRGKRLADGETREGEEMQS